ncbi:YeeE/YedE family protein [Hydrogenophaga sp.]|uniref:YeeE/YedE family protein n=1 Tax=Hydrogenophaga sp. TaxID=1904254 RepID=UPI002724E020|nr:YeeE/YedE family protein [Hydrogenophaga sp.]MDO9437847.1 YeeE/YedE family protein [Hydrogenophaga sp.]
MTVDWANFTPWASLAGGILIGIAAAMFILLNGRVLGVSGILGGLLPPKAGDAGWRIAFLLGLFCAPVVFTFLAPQSFQHAPRIDASVGLLILAGLLVGFGTRVGSGCTSGHGVCGISRLSPRSVVATLFFMGAGIATVFAVRQLF